MSDVRVRTEERLVISAKLWRVFESGLTRGSRVRTDERLVPAQVAKWLDRFHDAVVGGVEDDDAAATDAAATDATVETEATPPRFSWRRPKTPASKIDAFDAAVCEALFDAPNVEEIRTVVASDRAAGRGPFRAALGGAVTKWCLQEALGSRRRRGVRRGYSETTPEHCTRGGSRRRRGVRRG